MSTQRWTNHDAGPIQMKHVRKAVHDLIVEGQTYIHVTGVMGGSEYRATITDIGDEIRSDVLSAYTEIGERFVWTVTAGNAHQVVRAAQLATSNARARRPERDDRVAAEVAARARERCSELRALLDEAS